MVLFCRYLHGDRRSLHNRDNLVLAERHPCTKLIFGLKLEDMIKTPRCFSERLFWREKRLRLRADRVIYMVAK